LFGSEFQRLEHNSYHYTRPDFSNFEESTRRNQRHFPGSAQAAFTNDIVARFFIIAVIAAL
jgi:hypothetical protein